MFRGVLRKMYVELNDKVSYFLDFDIDLLNVNSLIGKNLSLEHVGYECLS